MCDSVLAGNSYVQGRSTYLAIRIVNYSDINFEAAVSYFHNNAIYSDQKEMDVFTENLKI